MYTLPDQDSSRHQQIQSANSKTLKKNIYIYFFKNPLIFLLFNPNKHVDGYI